MTVAETIQAKVYRLPLAAQKEVLQTIEKMEESYKSKKEHPLTKIAKIAKDVGVTDLAEKHDFYTSGKLED